MKVSSFCILYLDISILVHVSVQKMRQSVLPELTETTRKEYDQKEKQIIDICHFMAS
jgi:hypothetical protein